MCCKRSLGDSNCFQKFKLVLVLVEQLHKENSILRQFSSFWEYSSPMLLILLVLFIKIKILNSHSYEADKSCKVACNRLLCYRQDGRGRKQPSLPRKLWQIKIPINLLQCTWIVHAVTLFPLPPSCLSVDVKIGTSERNSLARKVRVLLQL